MKRAEELHCVWGDRVRSEAVERFNRLGIMGDMSIYGRFKRNPDGLRALVELLESTPRQRRERMIEVGMQEDPAFTQEALEYTFNFEDVLKLPDLELAEVLARSQARTIGYAIHNLSPEVQTRFLRNMQPRQMGDVKGYLLEEAALGAIGAAQLKIVESARATEKAGLILTKRIPLQKAI